ncbi:MAG TPA: polysaccharide biosynthesis tyrosine autokinase [Anaerolineae bacterium]|nr:polysaccharide biosynthesis tyrosine autokinase [Anaerolineae bacterium]
MELRQYWDLFKKWLWLIALTTIIAGAAAYFFSSQQTPIYRASVRLLVSQSVSNSTSMQYADILAAERLSSTYAQMLTARPMIEAAIAKAGLEGIIDPEALENAISVQPVRDTQLIDLHVEHPDPQIAAKLANTLPEVFVEFTNQQQTARYQELKESLQSQLEEISQEIQTTDERLQALGDATDPETASRRTILEDRLAQYRSTYGNLLAQLENIRLAEANALDTVTVVEPAVPPTHPVRPRVLMNTLLAMIIGGMIGLGAAFLIEYLDDTVKTPDDLARITPVSTLGIIAKSKYGDEGLITLEDPRSPIAEAYRTVRTGIQFASIDKPIRTLVVTSAGPGEGKSTTAANLAVVIAQAGKKVVLIDADLRKPTQHKRWKLPNTVGLTGALLMDELSENLDYLLSPTQVENLWLLTSGQLPHNPSELLGSHKLQELTDYLLGKYDLLLFDSPPALAVTDPVVLGRNMDGVIVVVDAGSTREPALVHVLSEMEKVNANIIGIVLNRYRRGRSSGYYYYYYDRYYSQDDGASTDGKGGRGEGDGKRASRRRKSRRQAERGWLSRQFSRFSR